MSEQRIEALESRVEQLEDLVQQILRLPGMKLAGLSVDGAPMIRVAVEQQPAPPRSESKHASSVHPADQAIKDGAKLKGLAAELRR